MHGQDGLEHSLGLHRFQSMWWREYADYGELFIIGIHLQTKRRNKMLDITSQVETLLENVQEGLVVVYSPHTTAGITINENVGH